MAAMRGLDTRSFVGELHEGAHISFLDDHTVCVEAVVVEHVKAITDAAVDDDRYYTLLALGDHATMLSKLAAGHQHVEVTTSPAAESAATGISALCSSHTRHKHGIDVELVKIRPISHPPAPLPFTEGPQP